MISCLVIEDDRQTRDLLVAALARGGVSAHGVGTLAEAQTLPGPDVYLADLGLPDAKGADVLAVLHGPVVVITGDESIETLHQCMSAGADDLLYKPARGEDVLRAVLKAASRGERHRQDAANVEDAVVGGIRAAFAQGAAAWAT